MGVRWVIKTHQVEASQNWSEVRRKARQATIPWVGLGTRADALGKVVEQRMGNIEIGTQLVVIRTSGGKDGMDWRKLLEKVRSWVESWS